MEYKNSIFTLRYYLFDYPMLLHLFLFKFINTYFLVNPSLFSYYKVYSKTLSFQAVLRDFPARLFFHPSLQELRLLLLLLKVYGLQ